MASTAHAGTAQAVAPPAYRWLILALVLLSNVSGALIQLSGAPMQLAVAAEFQLSAAQVATWINLPLLGIALLAIPAGLGVDRFGGRTVVGLALLVMGLFGLARGLAPTFGWLAVATFFFGLGEAMLLSGMPKVVAEWFPPAELGRAVGIYTSGAALGVIIAFLVAPPMFDRHWRALFAVSGGAALVVLIAWLIFVRDRGGSHPRKVPNLDVARLLEDLRYLASQKDILLLMSICAATQIGIFSWLALGFPFLVLVTRSSQALAGAVISMTMVGFLVGATVMAAASDRVGRRRPFFTGSAGLAATCFLSLPFLPLGNVMWGAVFLIGFACATLQVLLFAVPLELPVVSRDRVGACEGLVISAGFLAGMVASPLLGSLIGDFRVVRPKDFRTVWLILATLMFVTAVVSSRLTESGWKARTPTRDDALPAPGTL